MSVACSRVHQECSFGGCPLGSACCASPEAQFKKRRQFCLRQFCLVSFHEPRCIGCHMLFPFCCSHLLFLSTLESVQRHHSCPSKLADGCSNTRNGKGTTSPLWISQALGDGNIVHPRIKESVCNSVARCCHGTHLLP